MTRFAVFSIVVISLVLSVVSAGLLPNLPLPNIPTVVPVSKQAAVSQLNRGASMGKGSINVKINLHLERINADPTYTTECKQCIAERAEATRADSLGQIEATRASLVDQILNLGLLDSLPIVWLNLVGNLFAPNGLVGQILADTNQSLEDGRCGCLQQTMNQTCPTA